MTKKNMVTLANRHNNHVDTDQPVLLFRQGGHSVYWLGSAEKRAFRCNTYLVLDGEDALVIDPGCSKVFDEIREKTAQIINFERITGLVFSHQDPDVAASMQLWLDLVPDALVFASSRTQVLLYHYDTGEYRKVDTNESEVFTFKSGNVLNFIPAPFLHFPGAIAIYDSVSGYLFSGDVWGAIDIDWQLVVTDFAHHVEMMELFCKDYMASNRAARCFAQSLGNYEIRAILPQHGSIIPEQFVMGALEYLKDLQCGLDLIYPLDDIGCRNNAKHGADIENYIPCLSKNDNDIGQDLLEDISNDRGICVETLQQTERITRLMNSAFKQLKITELKLQESNRFLMEAQSIAHLGCWEWNIKTGALRWSDETYRIFGLSKDVKPTYKLFLGYVYPEDVSYVKKSVRKALDENSRYDIIHRINRPDGDVRTVHEKAMLYRDDNGEPVRMLGTVHDITEIARTEEALSRKNRLINAIQQMQSDFIGDLDMIQINKNLLKDLLNLTGSRHGFTGSVMETVEGEQYLILHALTDMSWNEESRRLFQQAQEKGLEFHNLNNMIGAAIREKQVVISNDMMNESRSAGVPAGHPVLLNYIGIPAMYGENVKGLIGLANRDGGYTQDMAEFLAPLVAAFGQIIIAKQEQEARRAAEKILEKQARLDGLLGIANRRQFDEQLDNNVKNSLRNRIPLALIMIDVDHFKFYNDFYGHQAGDRCLIQVSEVITATLLRPMDLVARYGGEEFCCVLPDTNIDGALKVAQKIRKTLAEQNIPHLASPVADRVTVSMGIVAWTGIGEMTSSDLMELADKNLYTAKQSGRDRIIYVQVDGNSI